MTFNKTLKNLYRFVLDNYFILIFLACIGFVGVVSIYKLFIVKPTYIYVRVKMGQGQWWASTQRPPIWFVKSIKKGQIEKDLLGQNSAEILSVRYYPYYYYATEKPIYTNQYDVFITMKLKVSGNPKTGKYNFNRSSIGVGAPIDFEFPTSQFSGTVIDISSSPITVTYQEKPVVFTKTVSDLSEYNGIKVGDQYFDGEEPVFEVLDKSYQEAAKQITIKARVRGKLVNGQFVFGDEQIVALGKTIYVITPNFSFTDYIVAGIE